RPPHPRGRPARRVARGGAGRRRRRPGRPARRHGRLRGQPAPRNRHQPRLRRRGARLRADAHRRGAGRGRGPAGPTLRRRVRPPPGPDAGLDRPRAGAGLLRHQHPALPPAGEPHADGRGDRAVPALCAAARGARFAAPAGAAGRDGGQGAAPLARGHHPPPRPLARSRAARGRRWRAARPGHAPPGLPAPESGRQEGRLARPAAAAAAAGRGL
ncbi:MAG: Uracil-DNA glycosylase, family 4, partial [uncultured Acetobacteraceae bacterium]